MLSAATNLGAQRDRFFATLRMARQGLIVKIHKPGSEGSEELECVQIR
jgi:hypothetical protein